MSLHSPYFVTAWAFCLLIWIGVPATGQEMDIEVHPDYIYDSYNLGQEQGLRGSLPYGFIQDQKGYIWLIANEWVQRYNGKRFETFFKIPDYRNGSAELIEDHLGRIWVFRYFWAVHSQGEPLSGLDIWMIDPETGEVIEADSLWKNYRFDFPINQISAVSFSGTGRQRRILMGTTSGQVVSIGSSVKTIANSSKSTAIAILAGNMNGDVALVRKNSLILLDSTGREIVTRNWDFLIAFLSMDADRRFYMNVFNDKEIRTQGLLAVFKGNEWQVSKYSELGDEINDHEVWLLQNDSFLVSQSQIRLKNEMDKLFECSRCPKLFLDRQSNIWATNSRGISVFQVQPKVFKTLLHTNKVETRGILPVSDTSMLVHSYRGTYLVDVEGRILAHNPDMNAMIGINKDQQGRIWETAHGWHVSVIQDYRAELTMTNVSDSTLIKEANFGLFPLPDLRGLWLGTKWGLCHCDWNEATLLSTCVKIPHPTLEKLTVNYLERSDTSLWAATSAGLFLIDPDRQQVVTYFDQLKDLNINHFLRQDSTFWFSTYYSGLIRWELGAPDYQQITLSTEEDLFGIPSLCAVYDDGLGFLWLPSISGLYRLRKDDLVYQRFDHTHHVAHDEFNYFSHARLPGNRFAFGGLDGITVVDPALVDQLDRNRAQIPLEVSGATVDNGKTTERISVDANRPIELLGQRDVLKLNCQLLDYRSSLPGQIFYKLEGLDHDWQLLEGETLSLERLPFGQFTLKIRASASDNISRTGEWNIAIIAREPWYRTGIALALLLLLVSGIGGGIVVLRYRSVQKAKSRLEVIVRERTAELEANRNKILQQNEELISLNTYKDKIMAIMGHDLRGPILGLSNLGKKMKYVLDRGEMQRVLALCSESERQIDQLRILIDNLLVWSLLQDDKYLNSVKNETNLREVTELQIALLQANADNKNISVQLTCEEELEYRAEQLVLGVLIRNLIANSIRYSPAGSTVSVTICTLDAKPAIVIEDEGPGMPAELRNALNSGQTMISPYQPGSQEGLGLGLWICSSLLPKLQCQWHFSSPTGGNGLRVRIDFVG